MKIGFRPGEKRGIHFELALEAAHRIKRENLLTKTVDEKVLENVLVACLNSSRKLRPYLITQTFSKPVEKITRPTVFGFKHAPDITIGNDGTAIELKVVLNAQDVRDCLGQALCYRAGYRFAIVVLVDRTDERVVVGSCQSKESSEYKLLRGLCDQFNIFSVVGPIGQDKNLAFVPKRLDKVEDEIPTSPNPVQPA
jgi:hypothetical protein